MTRHVRFRLLVGIAAMVIAALATPTLAQAMGGRALQAAPAFQVAVPAVATPTLVPVSADDRRVIDRTEFARFVSTSAETLDVVGVEDSLYRGEFFYADHEPVRRCIVKRESEGFYAVVSPGTPYYGAYQMSAALAEGATWMMLEEHAALLGRPVAKAMLADLREVPANEWPRYWQDAAFHTVYNWESPGSGAGHWHGGRWSCPAPVEG